MRITSDTYEEQLIIKKPQAGVILEPKEKGGMVTIMQKKPKKHSAFEG